MGLIQRHHRGKIKVNIRLINDVWWALNGEDMAPSAEVFSLMRKVEAAWARHEDPEYNSELVAENNRVADHGHLLNPCEQAALYRLRGWHRGRHGEVTVDAGALSEVRNILDCLDVGVDGMDCDGLLAELGQDGNLAGDASDAHAEVEWVRARIERNERCNRCEWCSFGLLVARIDATLDEAGFNSRNAWIPTVDERTVHPDDLWAREYMGLPWREASSALVGAGVGEGGKR